MEWTGEKVLNLIIKEYTPRPCLWEPNTPDNKLYSKKVYGRCHSTDVGEVNKNLILFLHCLGMRMYQRKKS